MSELPITSITEAFNKVSGDPVHRIQGKLIKIGKPRPHNGEGGVVIYQDGQLAGPDGKEIIKVKFGRTEEIQQTYSGQLVEISCFKSDKHGWVGVKVEDESYTNKEGQLIENRVLKVSKTANIKLMSEGPATAAPKPTAKPQAQSAAPSPQRQQQQGASGDTGKDFSRKAGRVAFALRICAKYCNAIAGELGWSQEDARAMTNTMFIEMKGKTDFNALPAYDPRKQGDAPAPPRPPEPPAPPEESGFTEEEEDNVPF